MNQSEERLKDWLFRYRTVFNKRQSTVQINRFIHSFVKDVYQFREDIEVKELTNNEQDFGKIIIVGNPKKARQVVATYYDTPKQHFGSYDFFNVKEQERKTFQYIMLSAGLLFLGGLMALFMYLKFSQFAIDFRDYKTWLVSITLMAFFWLASKVSRGISRRKNVVRNTSSILAILELMYHRRDSGIAYILIPNGTYGFEQIDLIKQLFVKRGELYYLDSIGSHNALYCFTQSENEQEKCQRFGINTQDGVKHYHYIISSKESTGNYYLDRDDLNSTEVNWKNINTIIAYFKGGN
ncbi:hypothetical protein [Globicatella sp. PHS-GS-PNBC-21-1553]|uniref:hypothetical protein n=1 Tax=Globicatella sp. PHS-GS-PNBC-21-1553 TaxID=2885764 RepID=UPI00298EEEE3|nr:hypothetical protein [Globicatella sp. PHS-GS-PNBC-21-1553]WPC08158.1 hypothetical protein LB888_08955 [Globicatella sp. PHS-GS-PNBC-21-1553]